MDLQIQGQPGLLSKFQDSQGCSTGHWKAITQDLRSLPALPPRVTLGKSLALGGICLSPAHVYPEAIIRESVLSFQ